MADYIVFGGVDSRNYGVYVYADDTIYEAAERDFKSIKIPGRSGDLLLDNKRFKNVDIEYQCVIPTGFASQARAFRNALLAVNGYARLTDSFNTDEFRVAVYDGPFEIKSADRSGGIGTFKLKFNCKPQRFLTSGEAAITFTADGVIENPTLMVALPKIVVTATSGEDMSGSFTVNGSTVTITDAPTDTLTVDSDLMSVYNGLESFNAYASRNFPVLDAGNNAVAFGATRNIQTIEIYPRWWRL